MASHFTEEDFIDNNYLNDDELINSVLQQSMQSEDLNTNNELNTNNDLSISENNESNIDLSHGENEDPIQRQSLFQENLFEPYLNFSNDLDIELIVNPLIFYHDYDKFTYYDNGKKVLAPKFLLHRLSQYNNIEYPIHIKINNTIFTVHEFVEDIDCIYISSLCFTDKMMNNLLKIFSENLKENCLIFTSKKFNLDEGNSRIHLLDTFDIEMSWAESSKLYCYVIT